MSLYVRNKLVYEVIVRRIFLNGRNQIVVGIIATYLGIMLCRAFYCLNETTATI